jgi:hypothetical protein
MPHTDPRCAASCPAHRPKMLIGLEGAHVGYVSVFRGIEYLRCRGWPGVTPAAISTDPTAGASSRSRLTRPSFTRRDGSPENQAQRQAMGYIRRLESPLTSGRVSHRHRRALPALTERRLTVSSDRASPEKQSEHIVEPYTDRGNGCRDVCPRCCSQNLLNSG